jgi:hypothetical protein
MSYCLLTVPKTEPLVFFFLASQHIMASKPSQHGHADIFTPFADFRTHALKRTLTALSGQKNMSPPLNHKGASSLNVSKNQPIRHKMTNKNAVEC